MQGTAAEQAACLEAIEKARGFIKIQLAERIDMFRMPELKFFADLDPETRRKQSEILRRIRRGRPRPGPDPAEKKAGS